MSNMEEEHVPVETKGETTEEIKGNEPDPKPLSETGYQVNPDGSVGHPGEEWDKT